MTICGENPSSPVNGVLDQMRASNWDFYLTGSRFFGNSNLESDWDFFTEDNGKVVDFLWDLGFTIIPFNEMVAKMDDCTYYDPSVRTVLVHDTGIHVQVLRPEFVSLKKQVQQCMKGSTTYRLLPKDQKRRQWALAWELLEEFKIIPTPEPDQDPNSDRCSECDKMIWPQS